MGGVLINIQIDGKRIDPQGFVLKVSGAERTLRAGDEAGAFYGCLALTQLIEQFGSRLPAVTVEDSPDFQARGVMLDVSRCKVPTMETCRLLIDRLAGIRINQVQLYIEHTFAFSEHETVWRESSPFTHEEIMELDQYCRDRFIELVPNLNSFGHFERWLRHPEYRHLAECPENKNPGCLAPNAASLKLLEGLYDEYLPHFSSHQFNVGCDETWELGKGRSKRMSEKTSVTFVYFEFLKKIHKLVSKKGSRMQFWGDIILHQPELIKELPKDIVALCWGYDANHPYPKQCPQFEAAGLEYYVCPGTSAWNSITGRTNNCLANLESAAVNGSKHGATGYLITDWGDGGHHQTLPISYLGFTAGAALSWGIKANRSADHAAAVSRYFFEDETGTLGRFCADLGRTLNRIPGLVRGNCSAINQLLFSKYEGLDLSKVTKSQYAKALGWLDKCEAMLSRARPQAEDAGLVMAELRHAVAMSRHAIQRARFLQYRQGNRAVLLQQLNELVSSHETQWLARNRIGGLHESSGRLRRTAEQLGA